MRGLVPRPDRHPHHPRLARVRRSPATGDSPTTPGEDQMLRKSLSEAEEDMEEPANPPDPPTSSQPTPTVSTTPRLDSSSSSTTSSSSSSQESGEEDTTTGEERPKLFIASLVRKMLDIFSRGHSQLVSQFLQHLGLQPTDQDQASGEESQKSISLQTMTMLIRFQLLAGHGWILRVAVWAGEIADAMANPVLLLAATTTGILVVLIIFLACRLSKRKRDRQQQRAFLDQDELDDSPQDRLAFSALRHREPSRVVLRLPSRRGRDSGHGSATQECIELGHTLKSVSELVNSDTEEGILSPTTGAAGARHAGGRTTGDLSTTRTSAGADPAPRGGGSGKVKNV